ncbi:protein FAM83H isoform X2 [Myripristis murdjan]|uniref:protein FAM83H isoform X2 n=1 Tax=Myripristis murdjan TaxID=586833 RepID=UPI0011761E20|nr:protein FAM83H-like isoform X2 [Myripristis murdjan]
MAHRSQCSSAGDNPLDPNYLPPHYREEYRLAIDALVEDDLEGYYQFLQKEDVVDFLATSEIEHIQRTIQVPQKSSHPERYVESLGDGSSDTYWPIHSDLEAPGLDLGWPQLHRFIGPTEVTTLVNPAEPDMPTIKEQARRLIKNAQQVVAIVMDMFTDVDIFADILNAAMRNVAVYVLLDEQNAHHFVNMVSNCRVNLESVQFLRVRTVSGITYHCRSGRTFKGQMMDRFLLTDCRAVLSGNYSFMWSFEKIHRCLAHLFLGQLVSTFDEEFRILFAQSQPLIIENVLPPVEDFRQLPGRQYASDRTLLYREPRKFLPIDTSRSDEWARHSFDERMDMDRKRMPLHRQEAMHRSLDQGSVDMHSKFPSQQIRMDPSYEQSQSQMPFNMLDNAPFKRHSFAEGIPSRQSSYPFLQQQGMPNMETQGRQLHWGQQPFPRTGPEVDYSGYEKFRGHGYQSADQYSEPCLPQELGPHDNFDPVLNYLSSTGNVEFDRVSDKVLPAPEVPFGSSHPKRLSVGLPYACQTSPSSPNPSEQKQFFQESKTDRKDPTVKQGLRNWRITSYLSAFDNAGEEDMPLPPPQTADPFEDPSNPLQRSASGTDLSVPLFSTTREFKMPARASQLPSYIKSIAPESSKKLPDDGVNTAADTKPTLPTSSESSQTTEGDKTEETEIKEPKNPVVRREESFRRKYNAAVQRSSRLRSSLIFSSQLEQHVAQDTKTEPDQQDEDTDKNEDDQTKLPFASQVLGQRRSIAREPFEWRSYVKSATFDNSTKETSKDDTDKKEDLKDLSKETKDLADSSDVKESSKPSEVEMASSSPSMARPKPSKAELTKLDQPVAPSKSLQSNPPFLDMSDPDNRLMFFKELAAKRKAAKAAAAEKSTEKVPQKPPSELSNNTTVKKEKPIVEEVSQNVTDSSVKKTTSCESEKNATAQDAGNKADATDSEKLELKTSQTGVSPPVSAGSAPSHSQPPEGPKLSKPAVKECSPGHPLTVTDTKSSTVPPLIDSLAQSTDKHKSPILDSTSRESSSADPSSVEIPLSKSTIETLEPLQLESSASSLPTPCESSVISHPAGSEMSSSLPSSSSDHTIADSGSSQNIPLVSDSPSSSSALLSTPLDVTASKIRPEDSSCSPTSSVLSPQADKTQPKECAAPSPSDSSQCANQTSEESIPASIIQTALSSDSTQVKINNITQPASSKTPSTADSACAGSNVSSDTSANDSESNTSSLQLPTKSAPGETDLPESISSSVVNASPKDVQAELSESPSLSHSSSSSLLTESALPKPVQKETSLSSQLTPAEPPPKDAPAETTLVANQTLQSDVPPDTSPSKPNPPKVAPTQATSPSEVTLTESSTLSPAPAVSCSSPQSDSDGLLVSSKTDKTKSNTSSTLSPTRDSPKPTSVESPFDKSKVIPVPAEPKTPRESNKSITSESHPSQPSVPAENSNADSQCEVGKESKTPDSTGEKKPRETEATSTVNKTDPNKSVDHGIQSVQVKENKSPEVAAITSDVTVPLSPQSKQPVSAENSNVDIQCEVGKEVKRPDSTGEKLPGEAKPVCHEKPSVKVRENNSSETAEVTSDGAVPLSPQSKQTKASPSRYHSSTANVLSSSNLRDDTKLLLEQISANSQSRTDTTKESPVTDDDKEDEADKNATRENAGGIKSRTKGQPKTTQEREKLLEKIQNMRKERKVYSRFEMAP